MAPGNAIFSGKYGFRPLAGGYLSVNPETGELWANAGGITPREILIEYTDPSNYRHYLATAFPSMHGYLHWGTHDRVLGGGAFDQDFSFSYESASKPDGVFLKLPSANVLQADPNNPLKGVPLGAEDDSRLFHAENVVWGVFYPYRGQPPGYQGADLSYVDFSNAAPYLTGPARDWTGANLQGLIASGLDLTGFLIGADANMPDASFDHVTFAQGQDLSRATLTGIDFSGVDLRHVKFDPAADFSRAKFLGANLDGLDLSHAVLNDCDFTGASLHGTRLTSASLLGVNFSHCDLTVALLPPAAVYSHDPARRNAFVETRMFFAQLGGLDWRAFDITRVQVVDLPQVLPSLRASDAIARQIDFPNITFQPPPVFDRADLTEAKLDHGIVTGGSVQGAILTRATLGDLKAQHALFQHAHLEGALLAGSDLTGANFDGAALTRANLTNVTAPGAIFSNANLDETRFKTGDSPNSDLTGAHFDHASVQRAYLSGVLADNATFSFANLSRITLTNASLQGAKFNDAVLTGAAMQWVKLAGADLSRAALGARQKLFAMPGTAAADLDRGVLSDAVRAEFAAHGVTLSAAARVTVRIPGRDWLIDARTERDSLFYVMLRDGELVIQTPTLLAAADLSYAWMPNAILNGANLCGAVLANIQWYGSGGVATATNADFEGADLSGANISSMTFVDLRRAKLLGVNFDGAILVNTDFREAWLSSVGDRTTTFISANLQGAQFTGAILENVDFTDAAMSLAEGVPLFKVAATLAADLDASTPSKAVPQSVTDAFATHGYTFLPNTTAEVVTAGERWSVRNGGNTPPATQTGGSYATFTLHREETGLAVSGSSLWVVGTDGSGRLAPSEILYSPTVLPVANDLPANVKLPSGDYAGNAAGSGKSWRDLLTPHHRPLPPTCVPSGDTFCPPPPQPAT